MVIPAGDQPASDATYHLAPVLDHESRRSASGEPAWPQYMVHVTLPDEEAASAISAGEICFGTEMIQDTKEQIVYLLLVCQESSTARWYPDLYNRLGVVIVDMEWYNVQRKTLRLFELG